MGTPRVRLIGALAVCGALVSGCSIGDLNANTLPGGLATGSDGYTVSAEFDNVQNLVPNSQVLYADVPIGTVRSIRLTSDWHARVRISLKRSVHLPSNVTATIGQKSLLGAEYVQLDDPAEPASTQLAGGSLIPLEHTSGFPETEAVLSAVSLLLNDGGLAQIKTITTQLNTALRGREGTTRDLLNRLTTFVSGLNAQKQSIISTLSSLDDLSATLNKQKSTITTALTHIAPGLSTLDAERKKLTGALTALGRLGVVGTRVIKASSQGLLTNLAQLRPTLQALQKAGSDLPNSLMVAATFPFPLRTLTNAFKGDYANLFVTLDLTLPTLQHAFLSQIPVVGTLPLGTSLGAGNALTNPIGKGKGTSQTPTTSTPTSTKPRGTSGSSSGTASPSPSPTPSPAPTDCGLLGSLLGGC